MARTLLDRPVSLVSLRPAEASSASGNGEQDPPAKGFAKSRSGAKGKPAGTKGRRKKGTGLSAADHGPLGRSPSLEAIEARSRLGLALAGRLRESEVTLAWKRAAAEHHPDRGGRHDTMQAVNGARDVLLGRGLG
ncbi:MULTISPECIES: molecular chaperone DnaJ [unclassified Cyanobium]|uniref:molecular chaperone DnaJ n=1 Tax=unclassified Cyanobium TaxID=2627006 RepID=UPI0020CEC274|nr:MULTISPECIES: molecular chaperone DnaJ [unclassified Cyanobium]MCP9835252.1 molecular chaperone DnaJ [Cyanobium sp. La Preciosa 7G6]MCP9938018.1 molecular chaperone DnaJ [Cyanobium sp. Aljojuca 7A6]